MGIGDYPTRANVNTSPFLYASWVAQHVLNDVLHNIWVYTGITFVYPPYVYLRMARLISERKSGY